MFQKLNISLNETSLFSSLFLDYNSQSDQVKPYYSDFINKEHFANYLNKNKFDYLNRSTLVQALNHQAQLVSNTSALSKAHIALLENANCYTITTGHQLCLFTGPLYFIYKIISAINLCKTLKTNFPDKDFVPVYWMASEDHDFEEINHVNVFGKKVVWSSAQKGAVGEFDTERLQDVINELKTILGDSENSNALIQLFEKAYTGNTNLADATRYLVNELFGLYGIITLDGNDKDLKQLFKEEFKKDIFEHMSFNLVNETIAELKKNYSAQVTPREINVFYTEKGVRERIEKQGNDYVVLNTSIKFTQQELEHIIAINPEKLSPNVVLRPLYQQKILPNIAYVGGPGEVAYWLQYKTMFDAFKIHLPILMPRNFVMLIDKGIQSKIEKLNLTIHDLFRDGEELVKEFIKTQHDDINLGDAKTQLDSVYALVLAMVSNIDKTLVGTTEAEKQKAINGLVTIEQKINRALKQKSETDINQIWNIKGKLFPNNVPQERFDNFSAYYSKYGERFISTLMELLTYDLENFEYTVLKED